MTLSAPAYYSRRGWHNRWNYRRDPLLSYRVLSNFDLLPRLSATGKYFLDVGCGAAASDEVLLFSRHFEHRVCVDLSFDGLTQARERYGKRISSIVADTRALPFRNAVFDQVYSAMMLHHVEGGPDGQLRAITEMRRVGGHVLITTTQGREGPLLRPLRRWLPKAPLYSDPRSAAWFTGAGGHVSTYRLLPNDCVRGGPLGWLTVGLARWLGRIVPPRYAHYITVAWPREGLS